MPFRTFLHYGLNPIAKAFIVSEAFFWSAWSILVPIISIFALEEVSNATVEKVTFAYSFYLMLRVTGGIFSILFLNKISQNQRIWIILSGIILINCTYVGFIFAKTIYAVYLLYGFAGFFTGLITPVRAALFSKNLDKGQEVAEWGILDAIVMICIAIAAALSSVFIGKFGFDTVFGFSAVLNSFSVVPYIFLLNSKTS